MKSNGGGVKKRVKAQNSREVLGCRAKKVWNSMVQ
jgi:hypothetical protein